MNRTFSAILISFVIILSLALVGTLWATDKGKLYLLWDRQTLTQRAGVPCPEGEQNFCHRNFRCEKGNIARGIVLNMDDIEGKSVPTGFGVVCADPNELYKNYEVGAIGDSYSGKTYRDSCDLGFFLAGAKIYTSDRKAIGGVKAVCRRYWPVEEREGVNSFGGGLETVPLVCEPGKFVTGIKTSYWRNVKDSVNDTGIYSLRF